MVEWLNQMLKMTRVVNYVAEDGRHIEFKMAKMLNVVSKMAATLTMVLQMAKRLITLLKKIEMLATVM